MNHSLIENDKEEIYACGLNHFGQLGLKGDSPQIEPCIIPNTPSNIVQICVGSSHTLFLDVEGNVFSFGWNAHGQLGLGHTTDQHEINKYALLNSKYSTN